MHELSIAEGVLQVVDEQLRAQGATRVHALTLAVGALSGVVPEALRFAWSAVTRGTPCEGATLIIEEVPVACYCAACAREFTAAPGDYACPACAAVSGEVRRGRELHLMRMEVS